MANVADRITGAGGKARSADRAFRAVALGAGGALLAVLALMLLRLGQVSAPIWRTGAAGIVLGTKWEPSNGVFGALPMIYGTLVTSAIALTLAVPVALGAALFITETAPRRIRGPVAGLVDLLAAVPSVVYGLWGIFVLVPALRPFESWIARSFGTKIPFLAGPVPGVGYLTAGVILAIMVLPTISAVSREVILTVPGTLREAALSVGATKWETIRLAVLPPARPGIFGAVILGLGRALGETIAVTMVIGNSPILGKSILAPGYTMASVIANEFSEATGPLHVEALIAVGLLLFGVTLIVNVLARLVIRRTARAV